jgi:hypothetical protein
VDEPPASETQAEQTAKVGHIEIIRPDRAPITAPLLDDKQYKLPLRVGKLFDSTLLPNNALRPMANVWIHWSRRQLLEIGRVVSPLRLVAERERATQLADENTARITAWLERVSHRKKNEKTNKSSRSAKPKIKNKQRQHSKIAKRSKTANRKR